MQRLLLDQQLQVPQLQRYEPPFPPSPLNDACWPAVNVQTLLYIILPSVGAGVLLILALWIYCCCCRKRKSSGLK